MPSWLQLLKLELQDRGSERIVAEYVLDDLRITASRTAGRHQNWLFTPRASPGRPQVFRFWRRAGKSARQLPARPSARVIDNTAAVRVNAASIDPLAP